MNYRTASVLTFVICVALLALASLSAGDNAVADSAYESTVRSETASSWACLPHYSEPKHILNLNPPTDLSLMVSADFNCDGWPDVVLARAHWPYPMPTPCLSGPRISS
jgi:hypothetical protein